MYFFATFHVLREFLYECPIIECTFLYPSIRLIQSNVNPLLSNPIVRKKALAID